MHHLHVRCQESIPTFSPDYLQKPEIKSPPLSLKTFLMIGYRLKASKSFKYFVKIEFEIQIIVLIGVFSEAPVS